jgi:hypothetical protein
MEVSDQELRALVREAIARNIVHSGHAGHPGDAIPSRVPPPAPTPFGARGHASHLRLRLARGGDGDGDCLIESAVRCNHCGYCLSYGH